MCPYESKLDAYHDGELDNGSRREVEEHVRECASCGGVLQEMRVLSRLFTSVGVDEASDQEMSRLHEAVESSAERGSLGLMGLLSGLAASILVISSVWLMEIAPAAGRPGGTVASIPAWERIAMTLQPDFPSNPWSDVQLADARLADWMLETLIGRSDHDQD